MRIALTSLALLLFGSPVVAAEPCERTPSSAARALYEDHQEFILSGAPSPPLSETFARAVKSNLDEQTRTGDSGLIDWNYWTDAQDGEQSKNAEVAAVKVNGRQAQVTLKYKFYLSPTERPKTKRAIVKLSRTAKGCWLIEDLQNGSKSVMSYLRPQ